MCRTSVPPAFCGHFFSAFYAENDLNWWNCKFETASSEDISYVMTSSKTLYSCIHTREHQADLSERVLWCRNMTRLGPNLPKFWKIAISLRILWGFVAWFCVCIYIAIAEPWNLEGTKSWATFNIKSKRNANERKLTNDCFTELINKRKMVKAHFSCKGSGENFSVLRTVN